MKSIVILSITLISSFGYSQSEKALDNEEISFIIVEGHSSKCEIYYSNGMYEEVHADAKSARTEGADEEETNNSMVIGKILQHGWKLHSITNVDSTIRFYLVRE